MKKQYLSIIISLFFAKASCQIAITEIYYDTPYSERAQLTAMHHRGEFIEFYNYTTEDIPLKGWTITDKMGKFEFPNDAIIKAQDFIVVAYRANSTDNYFPVFFPSTVGKESKIFYQDKIMLRNKAEIIDLKMGYIRGVEFKNTLAFSKGWAGVSSGRQVFEINNTYDNTTLTPSNFDFYSANSMHFTPILDYNNIPLFYRDIASPLSADYKPQTMQLENIPNVQNIFQSNYTSQTWQYYANLILNNVCDETIIAISQTPSETYLTTGKCFTYDFSGNATIPSNCTPTAIIALPITEYSPAEMEDISSKIVLYPNPTSSSINITWDASLNGKITSIQWNNSNGVHLGNTSDVTNQSTATINLSLQPTGVYILRFILNTSQFISKNVLKI